MELFVRSVFTVSVVVFVVLVHPEIKTVAKANATKAINLFIVVRSSGSGRAVAFYFGAVEARWNLINFRGRV
jgi:uncharacterized membrane protein